MASDTRRPSDGGTRSLRFPLRRTGDPPPLDPPARPNGAATHAGLLGRETGGGERVPDLGGRAAPPAPPIGCSGLDDRPSTLARVARTLVVQPLPGIGDMVWHLPHIHAIAAATTVPGKVDILTKPRSQADRLLAADDAVGRVLWLERDGRHTGALGVVRLAALLREAGYQRAWFLHTSARYVLAARLAGIPDRIGYGSGLQPWLLSRSAKLSGAFRRATPMQRATALLERFGVPSIEDEPRLPVSPAAGAVVSERYAGWPEPWITLGIGSSETWKQWGAARFAALALALRGRGSGSVFVAGGRAERALADDILQRVRDGGETAADAVALPLDQTAALLARSCCCVGNDTGVLNMAAAVGTPALGLFGASPPLVHSRFIHAITPPGDRPGMDGIPVDRVLQTMQGLH